MYYPIGWHKVLNLGTGCVDGTDRASKILSIQANHEGELYFILTTTSIHIWCPRPAAEIVCHHRSKESIEKVGLNRLAVWKTDSSGIVVATEGDQLLFFQIQRRDINPPISSPGGVGIYRLKYDRTNIRKLLNGQDIPNIKDQALVPALTMFSFGKLDLSTVGVSCLMSAEEELLVGSRNGDIFGIHWDGNVDEKFPWSLSEEVRKRSDFLVDIKFSSMLSGFALVFRSGRAGFMPSRLEQTNNNDDPGTNISYLQSVTNTTCCEINHRHRLVALGLKDSRVLVCNVDESAGLVLNHSLICEDQKDSGLGRIKCMRYSPDNFALAVCWEMGEFAIWSVFGSILFCSKQWRIGRASGELSIQVSSLAWGREGYNLWLCTVKEEYQPAKTNGHSSTDGAQTSEELLIMPLARCNLSTSPHQACSADTIVLLSEEKIFVGPSIPHEDKFDHWFVINVPQQYLNAQYPLRYASVDRNCNNLAIAGDKGLAYCSIETQEWTILSKNAQEKSFSVCGDLIWWRDYLIASCFNFASETFEIRAYQPTLGSKEIDEGLAITLHTPMEIIRMSVFENRLLVLYGNGTLSMFMLNLRKVPTSRRHLQKHDRSDSIQSATNGLLDGLDNHQPGAPRSKRSDSIISWSHPLKNPALLYRDLTLQISPIKNLVISNLQINPFCISSIALTRLHFKNNRSDDSILLNACGKLILLERQAPPDLTTPSQASPSHSSSDIDYLSLDRFRSIVTLDGEAPAAAKELPNSSVPFSTASPKEEAHVSTSSNVTFKAVSVIATNVEQFWISPEISIASEMSYFKKSLWLSCGAHAPSRLQVWLPLLNDKNEPPTDLYVPDRIMLPIKCDIYPLAIRSSAADLIEPDDAIVLGAESDVLYRDCKLFTQFPYNTVKRQCRVFLHRILRELLLSQHLGYYAKKIAESCQTLPYFAHCFELLLHEVLEEEATSPVPIPDPMLPQVVKFIRQFSVYLETVVHCARKSELSMWSHLFDERAVGNPRRLFQECLERQKYDTAASCLIILQSLEKSTVSARMVRELIRLVKESPKFIYLVDDLESFLSRAELDGTRSLNSSPGS